jgi:hypothetical protein
MCLADQPASFAKASQPVTTTLKFSRRENIADIDKSLPAYYPSFSFLPFQSMRLADQPHSFAKTSRPATATPIFSRRENLGVYSQNLKPFICLAQPSIWGIAGKGRGIFSRRENIADIGKSLPTFYLSFSFRSSPCALPINRPASLRPADQ